MAAFMDELVIDPVSGEQISARHAVVLPIVDGISDVSEYAKSVGSAIGANNIRSAYRVGERVKIYLRFAKHVDELVASGVRLRGHYASVEYSVLPATRVLLKNVDTEIPNKVLSTKLEQYGKVSRISTLKADITDAEYSHIESNMRQAFMLVRSDTDIPTQLEVFHDSRKYSVEVSVEKPEPVHAGGSSAALPSETDAKDEDKPPFEPPAEVVEKEVKHKALRGRGLRHQGRRGGYRGRGSRGIVKLGSATRSSSVAMKSLKKFIIRRGRGRRSFRRSAAARGPENASNLPNGLESQVGAMDFIGDNDSQSKASSVDTIVGNDSNHSGPLITNIQSGVDGSDICMEPVIALEELRSDMQAMDGTVSKNELPEGPKQEKVNDQYSSVIQFPFSMPMLEKFLREVKNNRNPLEVAVSMLEANRTPGAVNELCNQLIDYFNCTHDSGTRVRLSRLVYLISGGKKTL